MRQLGLCFPRRFCLAIDHWSPPVQPRCTRSELYVEMGGEQYNITDIIDRAKADYRTTHKVGVQSCKVYVKPEEGAAYYVINKFSGKLDL